jgi:hypothetical protein
MLKTLWILLLAGSALSLSADQLVMQNGDTYHGTVMTMTTNVIIFRNENLGRVTLSRAKVTAIYLGTQSAAPTIASTAKPIAAVGNTNSNLNVLSGLRSDTNLVKQVQAQMLGAAGPEAVKRFNELIEALSTGKMDMNGLRAEAQRSADQIRSLKQELGPEVGEAVEGYLAVLDSFLKESGPAGATTNGNHSAKP